MESINDNNNPAYVTNNKPHIRLKDMQYLLIPIAVNLRVRLSLEYDVTNPKSEHFNYRGLCDVSYSMLKEKITIFNTIHGTSFKIIHFHGEQKHSLKIDPCNWSYQHTWAGISDGNRILYVDLTSQQFKWIYNDIPDYYISFNNPKWYYDDEKNPYVYLYDGKNPMISNFIRIIQYGIWGRICKVIRFLHKS